MSVFEDYARYYDLLYRDKNYGGEVDFIDSLIKKHVPGAESILELGCGTGGHAEYLAKRGYTVHGIDISDDMLRMAARRHVGFSPELQGKTKFEKGDVRTARLGRKFDVVLSLFHVMSYQTTNEDILAAFQTAREHLNKGGIFLFDCWYGPAVLTDRPEVREKEWSDDAIKISRKAVPVLHPNKNVVDVNYRITVQDKQSGKVKEIHETHHMRYLFIPEIELLFSQTSFQLRAFTSSMNDSKPGLTTWNVLIVGQST